MKKLITLLMVLLSCSSYASFFSKTMIIPKGGEDSLIVSGLYKNFSYTMNCEATITNTVNSGGFVDSGYMTIVNLNGQDYATQTDYNCNRYNNCRGNIISKVPIYFLHVTNGVTLKFINRPEYDINVTCTI